MIRLVNIQAFGITYEGYILIESFEDLEDYYERFRKRQVFNANDELREYPLRSLRLYLSNHAYHTFKVKFGYENQFHSIKYLAELTGQVFGHQLEHILNGKRLAINLMGGYFPLPNDATIEDVQTKDSIFKPKQI